MKEPCHACSPSRALLRLLDYTGDMKIGAAARASGLTIKAIRHYESVCLLRNVPRSGAYRDFSDRDVDTLRLAAHCRGLGFSVAETKDVLALVAASKPDCPPPDQMNAIVENRLRTVRGEIRELERKARELEKVRTYVRRRLAGA
jgi:MerR family copper efflux transcriptional regulator